MAQRGPKDTAKKVASKVVASLKPERVVHARGAGAHGVFVGYGTAAKLSTAGFLAKDVETPVFFIQDGSKAPGIVHAAKSPRSSPRSWPLCNRSVSSR